MTSWNVSASKLSWEPMWFWQAWPQWSHAKVFFKSSIMFIWWYWKVKSKRGNISQMIMKTNPYWLQDFTTWFEVGIWISRNFFPIWWIAIEPGQKMYVNAYITTKPPTAPHQGYQYELNGPSLSFWTHSVSPCPSLPAAAPSPGATALTNSWITISPFVQPSNIPVSLLCLPWAQSDPIPAITLTTAAPGAALELDGLMTSENGR